MKQYQLSEDGFDRIKGRIQRRGLLSGAATALVIGVLMAFFQQGEDGIALGTAVLIFVVSFGVLFAISLLGTRRSVNNLRTFWETYKFRLGDDRLTVQHAGADKVTIKRKNVEAIQERPDEGIVVAENEEKAVMIPAEVEGYSEIRSRLSQWHEIEEARKGGGGIPGILILVGIAVAYGAVLLINNLWVVIPLGAALIITGAVVAWSILRNPNFEQSVKLGTLLIALMIGAVIFRIVFLITQAGG